MPEVTRSPALGPRKEKPKKGRKRRPKGDKRNDAPAFTWRETAANVTVVIKSKNARAADAKFEFGDQNVHVSFTSQDKKARNVLELELRGGILPDKSAR